MQVRRLTGSATRAMTEGNFGGAIANFQEALKIEPRSAKIHARLAMAYGKLAHIQPPGTAREHLYAQAFQHFERSLELNPNDALTHVQLGGLHRSLGEFEPAMRHFVKAYELEASSKDLSEKTLMNLAETALALGDNAVFFSVIDLAQHSFPNDLFFLGLAAKGKLRFRRYHDALDAADHILQIDPNNRAAFRVKIDALIALNEFDLATVEVGEIEGEIEGTYFKQLSFAKILIAEGRHLKARPQVFSEASDNEDLNLWFRDADENLAQIKQTEHVLWLRAECAYELGDRSRARQLIGEVLAEKLDRPLSDYIWLLGAYLKAQEPSKLASDEAWMYLDAIMPDNIIRGPHGAENLEMLKQLVSRINGWNWKFIDERVKEEFQLLWARKTIRPRQAPHQSFQPKPLKQ